MPYFSIALWLSNSSEAASYLGCIDEAAESALTEPLGHLTTRAIGLVRTQTDLWQKALQQDHINVSDSVPLAAGILSKN